MMMKAKLDLKVMMEEIDRVRAFVFSMADEAGLGKLQTHQLHLIVEEAVANVVNYSGATMMSLSAWLEGDSIFVSVTDDGVPFDPTQYPSPNLNVPVEERKIGGLGIHYIHKMSDEVTYRREDGKNILTMRKVRKK